MHSSFIDHFYVGLSGLYHYRLATYGRFTTAVEHTMEYTVEYTGRHGEAFNGRSTSVALTEGTNGLYSSSNFTVSLPPFHYSLSIPSLTFAS